MRVFTRFLFRWLTCLLLSGLPVAGLANCLDFQTLETTALEGYDISTVQSGLRASLENNSSFLRDGVVGEVTRNAMTDLCQQIPRAGNGPDVPQTLDLATDYGTLSRLVPEWRSIALDEDWLAQFISDNNASNIALRLAAGPQMAAAVLADNTGTVDCTALGAITAVSTATQTALDLLAGPENGYTIVEICQAIPVAGAQQDFLNAMRRLGQMDLLMPGAIDDLGSTDFAAWLAASAGDRMPRLMGSPPVVLALLQEFRASRPRTPQAQAPAPAEPKRPASCSLPKADSSTRFFAFSQENLDALTEPVDLNAAFAPLEEQQFSTDQQLWTALQTSLAPLVDQCTLDQIEQLVLGTEALGRAFLIDAEATLSLSFVEELQDVMPVVEPFIGRIAPDEDTLISGLTAVVQETVTVNINAQIELAAATLAASAEPVPPVLDTRPEGVPEFERPPLAETIGVTDATDLTIASTIVNDAFRDALADSNYLPATQPEILKGDVRRILRPVAQDQITTSVAQKMALLEPVVMSRWSLTPALKARIVALPDIGAVLDDPTTEDLATRMRDLVGLEYPNAGLFRAALDTVPPAPNAPASSPALSVPLVEAAINIAQREVQDISKERAFGPLGAPDCGCVPNRPSTADVYAFYPFWFAPVKDAPPPEGEDAPPPQTLELVDFGLVSRLAFYGMELSYGNPQGDPTNRNLRLLHRDRWVEARRVFVNSAHRHRAKVDVAFDLRDWSNWTAREIDQAAGDIAEQLGAFDRFPDRSISEIRRALPSFFDPTHPDGVTLVFEGYEGKTLSDLNVQNLIDIVRAVHAKLPIPDQQQINVAMDFATVDVPGSQPVLSDLSDLLLTGRTIDQKRAEGQAESQFSTREQQETEIVNKILIFLERHTTETKKTLRARMDRSDFRGKERSEILRSILPILPPGGHEFVFQRQQAGETLDEETARYSQLVDDIIYFEDNFSGVGFWPLPRLGSPDFPTIRNAVTLDWDQPRLPGHLAAFDAPLAEVCTWACPNRAYVTFIAAGLFAVVLIMTIRSFYSGLINQLAFRFGVVWIGMGGVIAMLFVLDICDHEATWPGILMLWLVGILALTIGYNFVQRVKNGPKP